MALRLLHMYIHDGAAARGARARLAALAARLSGGGVVSPAKKHPGEAEAAPRKGGGNPASHHKNCGPPKAPVRRRSSRNFWGVAHWGKAFVKLEGSRPLCVGAAATKALVKSKSTRRSPHLASLALAGMRLIWGVNAPGAALHATVLVAQDAKSPQHKNPHGCGECVRAQLEVSRERAPRWGRPVSLSPSKLACNAASRQCVLGCGDCAKQG